jgi:hypothetical protein
VNKILECAITGQATREQAKALCEATKVQVKREPVSISVIGKNTKPHEKYDKRHTNTNFRQNYNSSNSNHHVSSITKCFYCGNDYPHKGRCPAEGKRCNICKEKGHYAKCCKKKNTKQVKAIEKHEEESSIPSVKAVNSHENHTTDDDDESIFDKRYLFACKTKGNRGRVFAPVNVLGNDLQMLVDSGCEENVIDQETYEKMTNKPALRNES